MQRLVSGIQPSNNLTLGNYLGSIKQFVELQNEYDMYIFVADLHAITTGDYDYQNMFAYKKNIIKTYLAAGLDPNKCHLFYQSDILHVPYLGHLMLCHTTIGELERMTQYKDKSAKVGKVANGTTKIPTGLLTYPTLMAADILLYNPNVVPVGADQKQHMELTRNLAIRLNNKYQADLFIVPEIITPKLGARVMDLQNPDVKMSKSATSPKGTIFLTDSEQDIRNKIKSSKTDSLNQVKYDPINQPGISNLISIYAAITKMSIADIETKYAHIENYGQFKQDVADVVVALISDIQTRFNQYSDDQIQAITTKGAKEANQIAFDHIQKINEALGLNNYDK